MATNVKGTIDPLAQKYIDEMNENSDKYSEATTDEEKNKQHQRSVNDAAGLTEIFGYETSYDPDVGWTVWGDGLKDAGDVAAAYKDSWASDGYGSNTLRSATDHSDYISGYFSDAEKSALNALDASYQQNLLTLDAAAAKIPQQYYTAKNEAAAQNAQQNQAFNEYAAAAGLNSGAGGQASLASSNQLQSNLSGISQAQANALADVETQRAQIKTAYQSAVAQAIADNDLEEANALYQEMVRVDESVVATAQAQAYLDQNQSQIDSSNSQWNQQFQYGKEQDAYNKLLTNAQTLAAYGDFSGYAVLGYTPEQIANMKATLSTTGARESSEPNDKNAASTDNYAYYRNNLKTYGTDSQTQAEAIAALNNAGLISNNQFYDLLKYFGLDSLYGVFN